MHTGMLLATPKAVKPTIRYCDPDILKIQHIQRIVVKYYGRRLDEIRSGSMNRQICYVRNMIFYICVYLYGLPVRKVAKSVGKHRTTVLHGRNRIHKRLQSEPLVAGDLRDIRSML